MLNALLVGAMAASLVAPPPVSTPSDTPPPDGAVTVQLVTVNGSGCKPGTTAIALDPGNTFFTVTYSEFIAQVGVQALPTDARRNCQISASVHVPHGFTFAIEKTDYRGYASLQPGAFAIERANYYFQGMSQTAFVSHRIDGPFEDDWQTTDQVGIATLVWEPCGASRNLNINAELRADGGTSDTRTTNSSINMDSTDVDFSTMYHFAWRQCG